MSTASSQPPQNSRRQVVPLRALPTIRGDLRRDAGLGFPVVRCPHESEVVRVTAAWYDSILLEEDQRRLLDLMVQADNTVAKHQRTSFVLVQTDSDAFLLREGFPRDPVAVADLSTLVDRRLVRAHREGGSNPLYDVAPEGRHYWTEMKRRIASEMEGVEAETRTFIDSAAFIAGFPEAHDR